MAQSGQIAWTLSLISSVISTSLKTFKVFKPNKGNFPSEYYYYYYIAYLTVIAMKVPPTKEMAAPAFESIIKSQAGLGWKGSERTSNSRSLLWAGMPPTRPGCWKPHTIWPWTLPGMAQLAASNNAVVGTTPWWFPLLTEGGYLVQVLHHTQENGWEEEALTHSDTAQCSRLQAKAQGARHCRCSALHRSHCLWIGLSSRREGDGGDRHTPSPDRKCSSDSRNSRSDLPPAKTQWVFWMQLTQIRVLLPWPQGPSVTQYRGWLQVLLLYPAPVLMLTQPQGRVLALPCHLLKHTDCLWNRECLQDKRGGCRSHHVLHLSKTKQEIPGTWNVLIAPLKYG